MNYYTTAQLLVLRKELRDCKKLSPDVLALLQSISCQVVFDNVREAVLEVMSTQEPRNVTFQVEEVKNEKAVNKKTGKQDSSVLPPDPNLTEEERETFTFLKNKLNCPDSLIYKAFKESEQEWKRYDYVKWCSLHGDDASLHEDAEDEEMDPGYCDSDSESSVRLSLFSPGKICRYLASLDYHHSPCSSVSIHLLRTIDAQWPCKSLQLYTN